MLPSGPEISSERLVALVFGGRIAPDCASDSVEREGSLSWRGTEANVKPATIGARCVRSN
jgi:hypothetical protein